MVRKTVAAGILNISEWVRATDLHNLLVICITFKQFIAKTDKTRVRKTVILQDDGAVDNREDPVEAADYPVGATHVFVGIVLPHIAMPVSGVDDGTRCRTLPGIIRAWTRTVCDYQQLVDIHLTQPFALELHQIRPVKYDEND
jgi:hypothetical protein